MIPFFDFRLRQPPQFTEDGLQIIPASADGSTPSFTTTVPPPRMVPTQAERPPPPDDASLSTPENPIQPPALTRFGGHETLSPLGPVKPPAIPYYTPREDARYYGPMGSTPLATGAPTSMGTAPPVIVGSPPTISPTFGNPNQDTAVKRIATGTATPAGQPTKAQPDKPETGMEKFRKAIEHKDFTGAAKMLSEAFGGGKKKELQPYRMSGSSGGGGGVKDLSGSGSSLLASLMKERKGNALIGGELGKKQKKARQDDPHEYEQERFDWRRRSRR